MHENEPTPMTAAAGFTRPLSPDDLVTLNEEIAAMARAGLPLDQGLSALAREMGSGRLQRATGEIAGSLRGGLTLPEAIAQQAGRVPQFYATLLAIAVRSGRVGEVLSTLTTHARSIADLRSIVLNAIFYPGVVLFFSFVLFGFVAWKIIPQFDSIFKDFGLELPLITRIAVEIGKHPVQCLFLPPLIAVLSFVLARLVLGGTESGRRAWARFVYSIPIVGTLIRSTRLAAFSDLLAILVDQGTPLPDAFRLAGAASSDPLMARATQLVERDLSDGMSLGDALRNSRLVPELIAWMAGLGLRRGNLGAALHQVSLVYRRQAEIRSGMLRNVLPPFLIMTTAAMLVGFFVFALFLPLINLLAHLM